MDINRLSDILSELRTQGVRFALDDFGTGYSSIDILKKLKCDLVKIDKVFVDGVAEGSENAELISVMQDLAEVCGSKVCTEGIETAEQCEIVKNCGVESLQGYYFSRPVPLKEFCSKYN